MARPRSKGNEKLPSYVYLSKGRYILKVYEKGIFVKEIRLCGSEASLAEVWAAYESVFSQGFNTLRWLINKYICSDQFKELAFSTQRERERQKEKICNLFLTNNVLFGDVNLGQITPPHIRKYLDKFSKTSPVMANRDVAFLSAAFSWGYERGLCERNPCLGVRKNREKCRDRYVSNEEYKYVYDMAFAEFPAYISISMEIAFLCRARLSEVLNLRDSHICDAGLKLVRDKKSKTHIILWSDRLLDAIDRALIYSDVPGYILQRKNGKKIDRSSFQSSWQRLMKKAEQNGLSERFTFHDLKAKGVSDFDGDKKLASGHRSDSMVDVYDRLPTSVSSTR